jgi:hypothetical protein
MTHAMKKLTKTAAFTKNGKSLNGTMLIFPPSFAVPNMKLTGRHVSRCSGDRAYPCSMKS